ncbi:MAG: hypothetical protein ACK5GN_06085 [Pseudomonadota bacterium]|jgi:hypothetical protein
MRTVTLLPPLPPPLSHSGIPFVLDVSHASTSQPSDETIVAIAASLQSLLPEGDLTVDSQGTIIQARSSLRATDIRTLWHQVGLIEGIERSSL